MPFAELELYGIANCHLPCQWEPWNYIGEIKRSFSTRKKERIFSSCRFTLCSKYYKKGSSVEWLNVANFYNPLKLVELDFHEF